MNESRKYSVLVVDDENSNILLLTHILSNEYTVYAAKNGQGAIKAAEKYLPDIILLDIIMPDMDGYKVISVLKASEKTSDIPVIFITGLGSSENEEKGLDFGIADYIVKPFSPAIVKLRLRNQIKLLEQFRSNEYDIMKYKLANDALNIALWDMDVVSEDPVNLNNRFTWSRELREMLGFSDENDFPNVLHSWSNRLHPDDKERVLNAFAAHINDYTGKTQYDIEYRLMVKNGEYRHFHALGTTLRDSDGVPLRVAGAVMDINEKKQMEEKALEDEERMRLMIDAMPLACRLISRDHEIIDYNKETVKLFEMAGKEEYLKSFDYFAPEFQPCGRRSKELRNELFGKAYDEGYLRFEWLYQMPDGKLLPCELTLIRVRYKGENIIAAYTRDMREEKAIIEEMRKAEIAEESNKAKSQFLANMSHEMRTPMNVVVGLTDLMLDEDQPATQIKENLRKISTAGNTLLGLINDVLDISKIEAGKLELMPVEYEIPSMLNDIIALNMIRIEDKSVTFKLDINEDLHCYLYGDDLRVKQIINNLLSNAFKYTQKGTVTLGLTTLTSSTSTSGIPNPSGTTRQDVILSGYISDTGIGIREGDLKRLFTDYSQVDARANRSIEGTGLGLSITKRLTEMMNGEISAESEYGKGTTFRFHITQGFVSDKVIEEETAENLRSYHYHDKRKRASERLVRADLSYATVLVVDDMQTNLDVATGLLRKYKMHVDCVINGEEAVNRIRGGEPVYDAIFMDHMMPGMDGVETTGKIRAIGTKYATTVPIIALTANVLAGNEQMFLNKDFQAFLAKPINVMTLDSILQRWVRNKARE